MRFAVLFAMLFSLALQSSASAQTPEPILRKPGTSDREQEMSLDYCIREFNQTEGRVLKELGQSELTEKELIASIRRVTYGWTAMDQKRPADDVIRSIKQIAESEVMPTNAKLFMLRGIVTDDFVIDVVDIGLSYRAPGGELVIVPIREVALGSRRLRPEERRANAERLSKLSRTVK